MRHRCTKCKKEYEENAAEIITGCTCGNNRFFFVRSKQQKEPKQEIFYEDDDQEELITLDTETVNIIENGRYEIDVESLLATKVPIYKYSEGKYSIDISNRY